MVTKREVNFLHSLLAIWIILSVFTLFSAIYCIVDIWQNQSMNDNIFELIYMGIHLIVLVFLIMVTLSAFKRGSFIMRGLVYSAYEGVSIPFMVVVGFIFLVGLFLFIYGLLIVIPTGVYDFKFPITLKWAILNAGLLLVFLMGAFFLFPFLFAKNPTLTKKEEIEKNERKKQR